MLPDLTICPAEYILYLKFFMAKVRQMVAQMAQEFPGCVLKVLFILMYCVSHKFKTILEKAAWSNEVVTVLRMQPCRMPPKACEQD